VESVTIGLTSVPASALCIRITATPGSGAATVKTFSVTAGASSTNLSLGVLSPGNYTLSADAFNVACTSISGSGNWIADPVQVTVHAGIATTATLTFRKNSPVTVSANFVNNVKSIAVGYSSSYIVTDSGILQTGKINGASVFTRASFSAFDSSSVPGNAVVAIAPTLYGACALRADGTIWCWGTSYYGELGSGVPLFAAAATPVQATGISNASLIASGGYHVCALGSGSNGAGVYCWGNNGYGQLGNGTTTNSQTPVWSYSSTVKSLSVGEFSSYLVDTNGQACAWGFNSYGQIGNGTTTNQLYPTSVQTTQPSQSISAGYGHACALATNGDVFCWGMGYDGQIGDGTTNSRLTPTQVLGLSAKQVVSDGNSNCALTSIGDTVCWGFNPNGDLGDGTNTNSTVIQSVKLSGVTLTYLASSAVSESTCGLSANLDVYCWGYNYYGNLGDGTHNTAFLPVRGQLQ
jgi:alpha-tubulin suppressor-like RCC1 family protein